MLIVEKHSLYYLTNIFMCRDTITSEKVITPQTEKKSEVTRTFNTKQIYNIYACISAFFRMASVYIHHHHQYIITEFIANTPDLYISMVQALNSVWITVCSVAFRGFCHK